MLIQRIHCIFVWIMYQSWLSRKYMSGTNLRTYGSLIQMYVGYHFNGRKSSRRVHATLSGYFWLSVEWWICTHLCVAFTLLYLMESRVSLQYWPNLFVRWVDIKKARDASSHKLFSLEELETIVLEVLSYYLVLVCNASIKIDEASYQIIIAYNQSWYYQQCPTMAQPN